MIAPRDADEKVRTVRGWLGDEGWGFRSETHPEHHLHYNFTKQGSPTYKMIHPAPDADHVVVACGLGGDHLNKILDAEDEETVEEFLWEMKFGLLDFGVEFNGVEHPTEGITVLLPVYFDGTTKADFMDKFRSVKNAFLRMHWLVQRRFGVPQSPEDVTEDPTYIQ